MLLDLPWMHMQYKYNTIKSFNRIQNIDITGYEFYG